MANEPQAPSGGDNKNKPTDPANPVDPPTQKKPADNPSTNTNNDKKTTSDGKNLTQQQIESKLKGLIIGISDSNITILGHYMYKNPKKWSAKDDATFKADVNKLIPEAFASNMRTSNMMLGAIFAIIIVTVIALLWWIVSMLVNKNKRIIVGDPTQPSVVLI